MFKFIFRKTFYRKATPETQEMLVDLCFCKHVIEFFCLASWLLLLVFPIIPIGIIDLFEKDIQFRIITQVLIAVYCICFILGFTIFTKIFHNPMITFSVLVARIIYFRFCTLKGEAISEDEFKLIKAKNKDLYDYISNQLCKGLCYSVCFDILKTLKNGYMEFVAVKNFSYKEEDDDNREYTMHVLYIHNRWAFDTFSSKQYPIDEIHRKFKIGNIYKVFYYEDIRDISYEDFRDSIKLELEEWCKKNDCSEFLNKEIPNT